MHVTKHLRSMAVKHKKQYNLAAFVVVTSLQSYRNLAFTSNPSVTKRSFRNAHGTNDYTEKREETKYSVDDKKGNRTRFISYITDIEGDALYFDRFIHNSKILEFERVEPIFSASSKDYFPYDKHVVFKDVISDSSFARNDSSLNCLIFGGDLWDKGGSDLYCMRQLLSLQKRYGQDRVEFVLGNRDINKMRVVEELGVDFYRGTRLTQDVLPNHGGVYWFRGSGLQGDPALIAQYLETNDKNLKYALVPSHSAADRLKWMLKKTMGSPDAFEYRRVELQRERIFEWNYCNPSSKSDIDSLDQNLFVSDDDVVQSYKTSCHPVHGIMGEYISRSKLFVKIGNAAFIHGALPFGAEIIELYRDIYQGKQDDRSMFWKEFFKQSTPYGGTKNNGSNLEPIYTVDDWIASLNRFVKIQSEIWSKNITTLEFDDDQDGSIRKKYLHGNRWVTIGGYEETSTGSREFGSLCAYGMGWTPDRKKNPTCVYNSWISDGMPRRFYGDGEDDLVYQDLVDYFVEKSGFDTIVCGHQPIGDHPFIIRVGSDKNKFIICADTSYSGDTKWMDNNRENVGRGNAFSGRGDIAVVEVLLEQEENSGDLVNLVTHGVLSDGSKFRSASIISDPVVGTVVDRKKLSFEGSIQDDSNHKVDWFTKTLLSDGTYLVSTGKGYEVFNSLAILK